MRGHVLSEILHSLKKKKKSMIALGKSERKISHAGLFELSSIYYSDHFSCYTGDTKNVLVEKEKTMNRRAANSKRRGPIEFLGEAS